MTDEPTMNEAEQLAPALSVISEDSFKAIIELVTLLNDRQGCLGRLNLRVFCAVKKGTQAGVVNERGTGALNVNEGRWGKSAFASSGHNAGNTYRRLVPKD
jgi:hypothetical protein